MELGNIYFSSGENCLKSLFFLKMQLPKSSQWSICISIELLWKLHQGLCACFQVLVLYPLRGFSFGVTFKFFALNPSFFRTRNEKSWKYCIFNHFKLLLSTSVGFFSGYWCKSYRLMDWQDDKNINSTLQWVYKNEPSFFSMA